jgi:hypothetical protein
MNTTNVSELTFYTIIGRSGAELTGVDVGRTHGINCYTRNGKYCGVHSWSGSGAAKENYYEIATYLYEAYGDEK